MPRKKDGAYGFPDWALNLPRRKWTQWLANEAMDEATANYAKLCRRRFQSAKYTRTQKRKAKERGKSTRLIKEQLERERNDLVRENLVLKRLLCDKRRRQMQQKQRAVQDLHAIIAKAGRNVHWAEFAMLEGVWPMPGLILN